MNNPFSGSRIILASASPRRRELLADCGFEFEVIPADVDETPFPNEDPAWMVTRLARDKALVVASGHPEAVVIGADTTVVLGREILGKPVDRADAERMLMALSGEWHEVITGCAVVRSNEGLSVTKHWITRVLMRELSNVEIAEFIDSGEAFDKAGAYAIQGRGAHLVEEIQGSYTNVVGLNVAGVLQILRSQFLADK